MNVIKEAEYTRRMQSEVLPWASEVVKEGKFTARDGLQLQYYFAVPEHPKAALVMVHGYREFWGRDQEMAYYFYKEGYACFFMENRGHGRSGRELENRMWIHSKTFDDYVEDEREFIEKIVEPNAKGLPKVLMGHSMGGAISALYLEKYPNSFKCCILSSPMMMLNYGKYPQWVADIAMHVYKWQGKRDALGPSQHVYEENEPFETSSGLSPARYEYQLNLRKQDEAYQQGGATYAWCEESFFAMKKLRKSAGKVKIPVLILQAGQDHLVKPEGQEEFAGKAANAKIVRFPNSRHEIMNSTDEDVQRFFDEIFAFLKKVLT